MQIALMKSELILLNSELATNRLVLLHGWGADAGDLIPVGKSVTEGLKKHFEIVSLSAPQLHPDGYGRQWYPLYPHKWEEVPKAVSDLVRRLNEIATEEIPLKRTLLLGFSQGGAMALEIARKLKLAGIFALSSYPHPDWVPEGEMPPVFLFHGNNDIVVSSSASQSSYDLLCKYGNKTELNIFNGGHEITDVLIEECRKIIMQNFLI